MGLVVERNEICRVSSDKIARVKCKISAAGSRVFARYRSLRVLDRRALVFSLAKLDVVVACSPSFSSSSSSSSSCCRMILLIPRLLLFLLLLGWEWYVAARARASGSFRAIERDTEAESGIYCGSNREMKTETKMRRRMKGLEDFNAGSFILCHPRFISSNQNVNFIFFLKLKH